MLKSFQFSVFSFQRETRQRVEGISSLNTESLNTEHFSGEVHE